jgi:hypothetical protein
MKIRILMAALAAFSIGAADSADAARKQKRHKVRHPQPVASAPVAPYGTARPPWAAPWECYTDEGYGRFTPCSSGKDD